MAELGTRESPAITQYNHDAELISAFDDSSENGMSFDYQAQVQLSYSLEDSAGKIPKYLQKMQRGGHVQSFGCLLCIKEPPAFTILAYSENVGEFLGPAAVEFGVDVRSLFTLHSISSLEKAAASYDTSLHNPICVSSNAAEPRFFYAILHRLKVGIVVDLEPISTCTDEKDSSTHDSNSRSIIFPSLPPSHVGVPQWPKLLSKVISRIQSLPHQGIQPLSQSVVEIVKNITGYDRVMMYKFHPDEHGEVIAESKRADLESYLGLHYPEIDIPQAARFLFIQNRVRMICDCMSKPVCIIQELTEPLCLVMSTLRSPHACHAEYMANMGSIASLTMSIVIDGDTHSSTPTRLWGMVVCHHTEPRFVHFPLRYTCKLLVQAFALRLGMEIKLETERLEKKMIETKSLLYNTIIREKSLTSIVTGFPNIMDLVRCDGAAMYYNGKIRLIGVTPTESQLVDIVRWILQKCNPPPPEEAMESLYEAGYPGMASLASQVRGMAYVRIKSTDFVFWFRKGYLDSIQLLRSGNEKVVAGDRRMHPSLSFSTFIESNKLQTKSLPWEKSEIAVISSFQVFAESWCRNMEGFISALETHKLDKLRSMMKLIESATIPVIAVDCEGRVTEWNSKVAELTGLSYIDALNRQLFDEIILEDCHDDIVENFKRALQGQEDEGIEMKLQTFGEVRKARESAPLYIYATTCCSRDHAGNVDRVCFIGQDMAETKSVAKKFSELEEEFKLKRTAIILPPRPIFTSVERRKRR